MDDNEVGLQSASGKDTSSAGDVTLRDCSCPTYRECADCGGHGINQNGDPCSHCGGHGWHESVRRTEASATWQNVTPIPTNAANDCVTCVIGGVDRNDAEHCPACCEHTLCLFHEGVDAGVGWAIAYTQWVGAQLSDAVAQRAMDEGAA